MAPLLTYINNITPHPPPHDADDPKVKLEEAEEEEKTLLSPLKPPSQLLSPQPPHPITSAPCPQRLLLSIQLQRNRTLLPQQRQQQQQQQQTLPRPFFPFKPGFPAYDTLPTAPSSCKVVLLLTARRQMARRDARPPPRTRFLAARAGSSHQPPPPPTPPQPRLTLSGVWSKNKNLANAAHHHRLERAAKTDRTSKWEAPVRGASWWSGIRAFVCPRAFAPSGPGRETRVYLTKMSCNADEGGFLSHRGEIGSDEDVVECLRRAKH